MQQADRRAVRAARKQRASVKARGAKQQHAGPRWICAPNHGSVELIAFVNDDWFLSLTLTGGRLAEAAAARPQHGRSSTVLEGWMDLGIRAVLVGHLFIAKSYVYYLFTIF